MSRLPYKYLPEGEIDGKTVPVNVVFLLKSDIDAAGIGQNEAIIAVAGEFEGPTAINVFDMDAVTTTSDGVLIEGAIVRMGAADHGRVNPDFGILPMLEMCCSDELVEREPHLKQYKKLYPHRKLYRGPDPKEKIIPVHNVVISGRAANNNSATEMMNIITMDELIFPITGQMECVRGGDVIVGYTGEIISVGIGMTVAEENGRVLPHPQFKAGETAHSSGVHAKTLKKSIPCIVCGKKKLAEYTVRAIECGCVPARDIGCSPAVLSVAKAMGSEIDFDRITARAQEELDSVGCTRAWMEKTDTLTKEEVIDRADEIIPGVAEGVYRKAADIIKEAFVEI